MTKFKARLRKFELIPPGPDHITLTVQEVCVAEIEGAVDLFVRFNNLAAAHLLASAATELMRKRAKKLNVKLEGDLRERFEGKS